MKISTILDHIDSGHMALPEFQRGYVWNRDQVRGLFASLYRRHPVGGLLVWATESRSAAHRGEGQLAAGIVKLLLDGQQRMTSLYGVVRGHPPKFFDGNPQTFEGLHFHLGEESFAFYSPVMMREDPLWVDVTGIMKAGATATNALFARLGGKSEYADSIGIYLDRLGRLRDIVEIDLHIEEVTGADKTLDVVVDIFNRVNSGGTKLSKGDLTLAKICAEWPEARDEMRARIAEWRENGYEFTLDWLLRSVNTVLTGEAKFSYLHGQDAGNVQDGLGRASKQIDRSLNMIANRLGLDHDRVLFGRFAVPVMVRYLDRLGGATMGERDRDLLLFWFVQAGMWGRFSGSTETFIDQDLAALDEGGLEGLVERLRLWHGALRVEPAHFDGWSLGARFYPVLYMLTRMGAARDWGTGLQLHAELLGKMSRLEVHHVFPKAQLYKRGFGRAEVNALANFSLLTKETNLKLSDRLPEEYFPEIEEKHPGALASHWIPADPDLWRIERYADFLAARKVLLADEANRRLADLLHGDLRWLDGPAPAIPAWPVLGGITSEEEERALEELNGWIEEQGLPKGRIAHDLADVETGAQVAVLDLAWPEGLQPGLSGPVAVLFDESAEILQLASAAGYRCYTSGSEFRAYVAREVLTQAAA